MVSKKFLSVLSVFALVLASAASALAMTPEEEDAVIEIGRASCRERV